MTENEKGNLGRGEFTNTSPNFPAKRVKNDWQWRKREDLPLTFHYFRRISPLCFFPEHVLCSAAMKIKRAITEVTV